MRELVWEWLLADGSTVRATLDRKRREESVWVGRRLVSRAPIGGKPDGHSLSTSAISSSVYREIDTRVTFDAEAEHCTLRRGEDVVLPHTSPAPKRAARRPPIALIATGVVGVVFGAVIGAVTSLGTSTRHVDRLAGNDTEPAYVDADLAPAPAPVTTARVARSRPVRSLPNARPIVVSPALPPPVVVVRAPPRAPAIATPPSRSLVSPPRHSQGSGFTVDVVCDAQGACQGVKPVRLSMR